MDFVWKKIHMRFLCFVLLLAALVFQPTLAQTDLGPTARVAVVREAATFEVGAHAGVKIKSADGMKVLARASRATVRPKAGSTSEVLVNGQAYPSGTLVVSDGGVVTVDGKSYRGYLRVVVDGQGVTAVNVLPMELYIRSVLGGEISASWPTETLKAHAIASRSYAVYMLANPRHPQYDLAATVLDQVYPGLGGESPSITRAVDSVRNVVMVNDEGKVLKAFYSSNCGGHTADSATVFDEPHIPLRGVPDRFCQGAPNSHWVIDIGVDELASSLSKAGYPLTPGAKVQSVSATGHDRSGRIEELVITDTAGKERRINGQNLRKTLGYQRLKGTRAHFKTDRGELPSRLIFEGGGWGHGVGMCQWGAFEMGRNHGYRELLRHYYPEATLEVRAGR